METRNSAGVILVANFRRSTSNHCRVLADLSSKALFLRNCDFWKTTPCGKFSKFCSETFYCDTDRRVVFKFRDVWPTRKSVKSCMCCLADKNFAWFSSCRYCAFCAQNPGASPVNVLRVPGTPESKFHQNLFTFGRVIAVRVNTAKARRKANPIFD